MILVLPMFADSLARGRVAAIASERLGAPVELAGLSAGWWSAVEIEGLRVLEPGDAPGVLLASDAVRVDAGILALLFGSGPVRVIVQRPVVTLRERDGRLNVLALVDDLPEPAGGDAGSTGSTPRGFDVRIEEGRVVLLGEGPATYALTGRLGSAAPGAAPLDYRFDLARAEGGRIALQGTVADAGAPGGRPVVTGTADATGLDLETLAVLLESTAGARARGVVERLLVKSELEGEASRLSLQADATGLATAKPGQPFGAPLASVSVRLGALLDASSLTSVAGSIGLPQGNLTLDPESRVAWSAAGVDGIARIDGVVDDLAKLQDAVEGLLPAGVELRGAATLRGRIEGRWDSAADVALAQRAAQVSGSFELTVGGADVHGTRIDGLVAQATLADGRLALDGTHADVGGGRLVVTGGLPVADPAVGGEITWRLEPPVTLQRDLEGAGGVRAVLGGGGSVTMREQAIRLAGTVALAELSAPGILDGALDVRDGSLGFDVRMDPVTAAVTVDRVQLADDGIDVLVERGAVVPDAGARRASADATVTVAPAFASRVLAPWLPDGVDFGGALQLTVRGEASLADPADSLDAVVTLRVPAATVAGHEVRGLVLETGLKQGRATVRDGRATVAGGSVTVGGSFALSPARRAAGDELTLALAAVPVTARQELEPADDGRPRRAVTKVTLDGAASLQAADGSDLTFDVNLRGSGVARDLVVGSAPPRTVTLPDLVAVADGSFAAGEDGVLRIRDAKVTGQGLDVALQNLTRARSQLALQAVRITAAPAVVDALLSGSVDADVFRPTGEVAASLRDLSAPFAAETGELVRDQVAGAGELRVAACTVSDLVGRDLVCSYELADAAVRVVTGSMTLSQGRVEISPGTRIGFASDSLPFLVDARAQGVHLTRGIRTPLAIVNPLFLTDPNADDALVEGRIDLQVRCSGTWTPAAGWSRSITGTGALKLIDTKIKGSALLAQLASRVDTLIGASAAWSALEVLGEHGKVGKVLVELSERGYGFDSLDTELLVEAGRIRTRRSIRITSKDLTLTLDGSGSLDGDLDYRIGTDIVARLRTRAKEKLSKEAKDKGGWLGAIVNVIDPLAAVVDIEVGATVTGNAFAGTPSFGVSLIRPAK